MTFLPLLFGAGCSEIELVPIRGTVTLDSKNLPHGSIRFQPIDGKGHTVGAKITDGQFTAELTPGPKHVVISCKKSVDSGQIYSNGPVIEQYEEIVPARYNRNSKLSVRISPQRAEYDFTLVGKKTKSVTSPSSNELDAGQPAQ